MASESSSMQAMDDSVGQKRQRGAHIMKQIDKKAKNGKIRVDWSLKAQPIGEHVSLFQLFIGYHTRARVPVSIPNWKAVPKDGKVLIFEAVVEISECNSEKVKLNIYPYKCARRSYAVIEQDMIKERGLDPTVDTIPRYDLWAAGRETDGSYDAVVTKVVANINLLKEQVFQGQISPEGREDLLTIALGKEDHCGRIKGVGVKYFGGRRARYSGGHIDPRVNELEQTVKMLMEKDLARDQQLKDLLAQLVALTKNREETHAPDSHIKVSPPQNENASCSITPSPSAEKPMDVVQE